MFELTYTLAFQSAVSIFSGLAVAGLVDRIVFRDHEGLPCIPGSSVKGRWRFVAERFLRSLPMQEIPNGLSIHEEDEPLCKLPENACTICKLFGNSSIMSLLWIGQAELDDSLKEAVRIILDKNTNPVVHPDTELRPGIALSRIRRTALENHLLFEEAVPPANFSGKLLINGSLTESESKFIFVTARLVDRIGGRKGVGRGILRNGIEISGGDKWLVSV